MSSRYRNYQKTDQQVVNDSLFALVEDGNNVLTTTDVNQDSKKKQSVIRKQRVQRRPTDPTKMTRVYLNEFMDTSQVPSRSVPIRVELNRPTETKFDVQTTNRSIKRRYTGNDINLVTGRSSIRRVPIPTLCSFVRLQTILRFLNPNLNREIEKVKVQ